MSEDLIEKSKQVLAKIDFNDTTYEVARDVVLDEIERLNKELKSLQDSYDIEEEQANYHIDLTDDLREEVDRLNNIIKEVREYIENNSLYEQDYDYDYEENLYEYPPSDEQARKDILSILDKENK